MESSLTTFYINHFGEQSGDLCDDALKLIKIRHAARKVFSDIPRSSTSPIAERIRAWFRPMAFDIAQAYVELESAVYDLDPIDRDPVCIKIFSHASRVSFTTRLFYSVLDLFSWTEECVRHEIKSFFRS